MKYFKFLVLTCLSFFLFLILPQDSFAATYYVAGDTGLDTNNGSITTPWKTIQKAAGTALQPGDIVKVKGGLTYAETVTPSTSGSLGGGYITYQAWSGTGIPVIDAQGTSIRNFYLNSKSYIKIDSFKMINSTLEGLKIQGGSYVSVSNSIFSNQRDGFGFGIGVYTRGATYVSIIGNSFNNCDYTVYTDSSVPTGVIVENNIFYSSDYGLSNSSSGDFVSNYNVLFNNITNYSGRATAGPNDITSDPLFVSPSLNNLHLQRTSPAINTGTDLTASGVTTDILGVPRPQGSAYDIGAYEYYDIPVTISGTYPNFSGTASTISTGTVSRVEYQLNNGDWVTSGVNGTNSFTINTPILQDGTYTMKVRAVDSYTNTTDESLYATTTFNKDTVVKTTSVNNTCTAVKPEGTPVITNVVSLSPTQVKLVFSDSWTNTVDSYFVEYGTKPNVYQYSTQSIGGKGTKETIISNLTPNKTYYFRIRNGNNCNVGNWSLPVSIKNEKLIVNNLKTPTTEIKTNAKEIVTPKPTATPISVVQTNQKTNILQTIIDWFVRILSRRD